VDETLRKKILNEATAYLRSYVSQRGRNVDLAATAVTDAKAFSEKEALDGKLIDMAASSTDALLAQLDGRTITRFDGARVVLDLKQPVVENFEMTPRQRFLSRLVQPDMFFILLIIGVLGLYAEFTHPGLFAPGVIGGIALVLALYAMHLLPVNLTGLVLLALAVGLFVLEAKFPTHGILGVGGAAAMVLGDFPYALGAAVALVETDHWAGATGGRSRRSDPTSWQRSCGGDGSDSWRAVAGGGAAGNSAGRARAGEEGRGLDAAGRAGRDSVVSSSSRCAGDREVCLGRQ
jgi:membrane-bound ClpP family serine protease